MEKRIYAPVFPLRTGVETRAMVFYFGISVVIHLAFIGSVAFYPDSPPRPRLGQGAINVSLVSLPGPPAAAPAPAKAPAPVAAPKPVPKAAAVPQIKPKQTPKAPVIETPPAKPPPVVPKPEKPVSLAPERQKAKVKKSLKKKTQNRKKMIDQALTGVQQKVEKSQDDSVRQALDRLRKKVAQSEASGSRPGNSAKEKPTATGVDAAAGTSGAGGRRALEIVDLYKIEVAFQVERHWAFSHQIAGDDQILQTRIVFRVMPNGEISDIRFTQKSGNAYLDESAYKAIVKANPVSPHPSGVRVPYVTVGLRFTPEGLRK